MPATPEAGNMKEFASGRAPGDDERGFVIESPAEACAGCRACVRACPARAIRMRDQHSEVIEERCVRCGACVAACGRGGHSVRDDVPVVRRLLAGERPVVAVLATEFVAAMHPMSPTEVESALEALGFYAVETTLLGEELVALAYEEAHSRDLAPVVLRSTCPVAVSWVRHFRPALVGALAPIVPPYIAQARLVKSLYPEGVAVVYVSPCYARKDEIADPQFFDAVDAAIDFTELKRLISSAGAEARSATFDRAGSHRPAPVKEISLTDGYPRQTLVERDMTSRDVAAVRGLDAIDSLLGAVQRGEAGPLLVDMLKCDGCLDGPATGSALSIYAKRAAMAMAGNGARRIPVDTRTLLAHLPAVELVRSFTARPAHTPVFGDEEVTACLIEGEFEDPDEYLDCGGCGYDTCREHASAILARDSSWEMCFPLQRKRLERSCAELTESATLDALTGLWNRRVFSERLESEVARAARYGTPLTLLMIDLDSFKEINDAYGHTIGDAVLAETAAVMRAAIRETDVPARYGGDEFALILPGVDKMAGYSVAEKIRSVISSVRVPAAGEGSVEEIATTVSVGLASAREGTTSQALVEAADRALYRAKAHGRDQVRIAAD